jgi:CheY-like chemotaxis protein
MGGEIGVYSPGTGSTFTFHVLMQEAPEEVVHRTDETAFVSPELSILLVEDHPVNQIVVLSMLRKLKLKADCAATGLHAVEMVRKGNYDLVFMDMQLPGIDGMEATRQIRASALPRQPYIVALTANAFVSDKEACVRAGMDDFLTKPFQMAQLRAVLLHLSQRSG